MLAIIDWLAQGAMWACLLSATLGRFIGYPEARTSLGEEKMLHDTTEHRT